MSACTKLRAKKIRLLKRIRHMIKFKPHEEDKHGRDHQKRTKREKSYLSRRPSPKPPNFFKEKERVQNWSIFCANLKHMVQYTSHFVKFPYSKVVHLHLNPEGCIIHYFTGSWSPKWSIQQVSIMAQRKHVANSFNMHNFNFFGNVIIQQSKT